MSDDLMQRLHSLHKQATVERSHFYVGSCAKDAMHRIEELEAKLAKALEALDEAVYLLGPDEEDMMMKAGVYRVVTTLAELKGQDDE